MNLSNNFKDIYGIVLNDTIDFQNQNLKAIHSLLFKINYKVADFNKSDFDFFLPNTKTNF